MSLPISYSLTDDQVDGLLEHYDTDSVKEVKSELRNEVDDMVKGKIDEE